MLNQQMLLNTIDHNKIKYRWLIVVTIMMLSILEVLDSTIINVSLPSMMASLGANQTQITWILTAYLVSSAIVLPLSGFLSNRIGRKQFLIICTTGFMLSSLLCGLSTSLSEIVIFRILQGACGASLIPISQTILRESFPLEQQGKAMAIWGLGIMTAPVCGPTLGGFITEYATWPWLFFINLPFCLIGLFLILTVLPKTKQLFQKIDMLGLILMVVGVGSLQILLDKGNESGWFESNFILALAIISTLCITSFILHSLFSKNSIIKLKLFKDRNFALSCIVMLLFCGAVFSFITIQPIMLENYFNYDTVTAGITMGMTGVSSAIAMIFSSLIMEKVKVKYLITSGILLTSLGLFYNSLINLSVTQGYFLISNGCIGFGMGLIMVPLSTYVFTTLNKRDIPEASGLFSYSRMLGTSIGISLISTLLSRLSQISWHSLSTYITPFNKNLAYWLQAQHLHSLTPTAISQISQEISRQGGIISFTDAFRVLSIILLLQIPIVMLMKSVKMTSSLTHRE